MLKFTPFESKPVTRMAYQVTVQDVIGAVAESVSMLHGVEFKHYEKVQAGDWIVRLTETDTYHCTDAVFRERNIVPQ